MDAVKYKKLYCVAKCGDYEGVYFEIHHFDRLICNLLCKLYGSKCHMNGMIIFHVKHTTCSSECVVMALDTQQQHKITHTCGGHKRNMPNKFEQNEQRKRQTRQIELTGTIESISGME